jgi:hypothetical protein
LIVSLLPVCFSQVFNEVRGMLVPLVGVLGHLVEGVEQVVDPLTQNLRQRQKNFFSSSLTNTQDKVE